MSSDLEQFCILARTLKGKACVALIQQVLSHHKIFLFGELLSVPSIQGLKESENCAAFKTLELFAYGTYQDYLLDRSLFLDLTPGQLNKLKQLTIVTLGTSQNILSYSYLQEALNISSTRELESLILDSMYNNLLTGKLDQKAGNLFLKSCSSRDVRSNDIQGLIDKFQLWKQNCLRIAEVLESNSRHLETSRRNEILTKEQIQGQLNKTVVKFLSDVEREEGDEEFGSRMKGKRSRGTGPSTGMSLMGFGMNIMSGSRW